MTKRRHYSCLAVRVVWDSGRRSMKAHFTETDHMHVPSEEFELKKKCSSAALLAGCHPNIVQQYPYALPPPTSHGRRMNML